MRFGKKRPATYYFSFSGIEACVITGFRPKEIEKLITVVINCIKSGGFVRINDGLFKVR